MRYKARTEMGAETRGMRQKTQGQFANWTSNAPKMIPNTVSFIQYSFVRFLIWKNVPLPNAPVPPNIANACACSPGFGERWTIRWRAEGIVSAAAYNMQQVRFLGSSRGEGADLSLQELLVRKARFCCGRSPRRGREARGMLDLR